jgi:hypothetical protein
MHKRAAMGRKRVVKWGSRRTTKNSPRFRSVRQDGKERKPELDGDTACRGVVCGFGATCVGVLLERIRLHLGTQRFLAARRGDPIWEASCDYAALSLERLGARLRPGMFEQPLFPKASRCGPSKGRARRGASSRRGAAGGAR